ncbi:exodeoxyribonuclease V subunit beta [Gracilimonas tropica]|uniref:exodeoxyribonuclease V subunit beta n=1 Tax=Gracilimonas tropica TaxID=454600 RepID=UPI00035F6FA2|nr:exodeoxyribonuclease V subunit beta [Gracilimonas tropica]
MKTKTLDIFEAPLKGISLVEASAGTGKTYNITSLYIRAILELELEPSQILVMTFTEAATAELKSRIRSRIKEALDALENGEAKEDDFLTDLIKQEYTGAKQKLDTALKNFDESAVFTIHGFCNRVLNEYSLMFDVPPQFELLPDASELLQDCVDDFWREFMYSTDENELNWFILDYLGDTGFGPDELRNIIEETFTHPNSRIVPQISKKDDFEALLAKLKDQFEQLKQAWQKEGDQISDMYLNGKLSGQAFKKGSNSWKEDWQSLMDLLSSDQPKIAVTDRLARFGSYMKDKGSKKAFQVPDLNFFKEMDEYIALREQFSLIKPTFILDSTKQIKEAFEQRKRTSNVLTYNDLLERTELGLSNDQSGILSKKLSRKYPLALVDEFQDTDPVQYHILKKIYHGREETGLFMIGDPKQAIYGFRGADIFTYLSAKSDTHQGQSYHLLHNYRSNSRMIEGVNDLFSQAEDPFLLDREKLSFLAASYPEEKEEETYLTNSNGDVPNPLQFIALNEEYYSNKDDLGSDIVSVVCDEITELLSGNYQLGKQKVQQKDIAILVREGKEGETIQSALRERGISAVLRSRSSVFKTMEAEELLRILSAVQRMSYEGGIRAALATSLMGYTALDLLHLDENEREWSTLMAEFNEIKESWEQSGIEVALDELLYGFEIVERVANASAAERRISNLYHIIELLSKAARMQKLDPKSLLKWFYGKVNEDTQKATSEDEELRLESDKDLIQISTMHASKGLEYPIVICPSLWNSRASTDKNSVLKFHDNDSIHIDISRKVDHPEKERYRSITEHQNRAEDVRLAYVALTRASSACFVLLPDYKNLADSPIAYILNGQDGKGNFKDFETISGQLKEASNIEVRQPAKATGVKIDEGNDRSERLHAAKFDRTDVFHFPKMLSYSSLAGQKESSGLESEYEEMELYKPEPEIINEDIFGFPKGANAGTCLHKIFEDIEFNQTEQLQEVVSNNLEYFGIADRWEKVVTNWVKTVLNHNLKGVKESLSTLKRQEVLKEMEFFFPVKDINTAHLWELIRPDQKKSDVGDEKVFGFMKGFIDLVFKKGEKFFILDYKSNYLGHSFDDYREDNLDQAMQDAGYDLQYHIYTLALHRYLRSRLKEYNYHSNFGGVLYLYLRGVDADHPGSGVYFHKPEQKVITRLDSYFERGSA